MTGKVLRRWGLGLFILAVVAVVVLQQRRITELAAENLALREQLEDVASAQTEIRQPATDPAEVTEPAESRLNELMRLRALASRTRGLEQENARLEAELDSLRVPRGPEESDLKVADEDTPEWTVARAAMVFSKELGFALHAYAQRADGQMPPDLHAAVESLEPGHFEWYIRNKMPKGASFDDVKDVEFELVYHGSLYDRRGRAANEVIVARQVRSLQLSNGRWARACLFADGSSRVLVADSLDALAAIEDDFTVSSDAPEADTDA